MMKNNNRILLSSLLAAMPVMAQLSNISMDDYQQYLGRKGLEIKTSGVGNLVNSSVSGSALVNGQETSEKMQTTLFDLDFKFRPKDWASARVIMRFHQDWQTYFMARSRAIGFRWASADGVKTVGEGFGLSYNVGDFKDSYSPLSLWAPELHTMGDSKYYANQAKEAQAEYFLGDEKRQLRGLNLKGVYRIQPGTEARLGGFYSRLKRQQYLDLNGKMGSESIQRDANGFMQESISDMTDYDAYGNAVNAEFMFSNGLFAGLSLVNSFEDEKSFNANAFAYNDTVALANRAILASLAATDANRINFNKIVHDDSLRTRSLINPAMSVKVMDVRFGFDLAGFNTESPLIAQAELDYATSKVSYTAPAVAGPVGSLKVNVVAAPIATSAKAMVGSATLGYKIDSLSKAKVKLQYIANDAAFANPLAQTPTYLNERIMNIDGVLNKLQVVSALDGMYYNVYNYTPNPRVEYDASEVPPDGLATPIRTSPYQNSTYNKNSYTNAVHFRQNTERLAASGLQEVLPFGLATPDRKGLGADLNANYMGDAVKFHGVYGGYKGMSNTANAYNQMGVGLHVNALKLAAVGDGSVDLGYQTEEGTANKSTMLQVGADVKVWDRVGLLGSYQTLTQNVKAGNSWYENSTAFDIKHAQWMAGVDYEFASGFYVLAAYGKQSVDVPAYDASAAAKLEQGITNIKVRANF